MRRTSSLVVVCGLAGALVSAADVLTPQLGNAFAKKVVLVQEHANAGVKKPLSTTFTQAETNSYLKYNAGDLLPTGLTQPDGHADRRRAACLARRLSISISSGRNPSSGGWFDPTSYLTGKLPVTASGRIITGDGKARFEIERAEVSGMHDPAIVPRADGQLLHAHRRQPERIVDRRHLRNAREDPPHRRRVRPLHRPSITGLRS